MRQLMVFRDNHRMCPRCNTALEEMRTSLGHRFLFCEACGGNWVAQLVLREMFDRLKPGYGLPALHTREDSDPTLTCPMCSRPLAKRWMKRLLLDQCDEHGVWFDGQELHSLTWKVDQGAILRFLLRCLLTY